MDEPSERLYDSRPPRRSRGGVYDIMPHERALA